MPNSQVFWQWPQSNNKQNLDWQWFTGNEWLSTGILMQNHLLTFNPEGEIQLFLTSNHQEVDKKHYRRFINKSPYWVVIQNYREREARSSVRTSVVGDQREQKNICQTPKLD